MNARKPVANFFMHHTVRTSPAKLYMFSTYVSYLGKIDYASKWVEL